MDTDNQSSVKLSPGFPSRNEQPDSEGCPPATWSNANSIRDQAPTPSEASSKSHQRAPWFAVKAPTLAALGPTGRALHAAAILRRAETILARIGKPYQIDLCFALEEAADQLRREGVI